MIRMGLGEKTASLIGIYIQYARATTTVRNMTYATFTLHLAGTFPHCFRSSRIFSASACQRERVGSGYEISECGGVH